MYGDINKLNEDQTPLQALKSEINALNSRVERQLKNAENDDQADVFEQVTAKLAASLSLLKELEE